ncbi:acetate--CoA ligase family protein [Granulosicoccus sp. 3-233]|uniref:acetate--CoA ligase family protein n=1 Tax=Granulosicoccus sp. 3-233 TaxID=3417969 RepID=UPI003D342D55
MTHLNRLLRPRSVAVLGGHWAQNVIEQLLGIGFTGSIYPIHPTRKKIAGLACLPSLDQLPESPDATFIGVNRHATIDCVQALSNMNAGGAVCFASGWSERAEFTLQDKLLAAAGDMALLGPNCYGFINYLDGALLWPDQHGGYRLDQGVAIVCQSSNVAINLSMQARGLPVAMIICLGNAAQMKLADLLDELLDDARISALGFYIEGIDDPVALTAVAERARARNTGLVALRSGRTQTGAAAAATHTAALAGDNVASRAFLAQAGIAEVTTLDALVETLKILHVHGPLSARRFCAVTCSGGEAALLADLADGVLELPPPTSLQCENLSNELGSQVTIANPLDYQTFLWGDADASARVFQAMLTEYDAGLFVIDIPRTDRCDPTSFEPALTAMEVASRQLDIPAFPVASLPENFGEARARSMIDRGMVPLFGLECAIRAVAAASTPAGSTGWRPIACQTAHHQADTASGNREHQRAQAQLQLLDEAQAKTLLKVHGVNVPRFVTATTLAALQEQAESLSAPLVLKGLGFLHKSEADAVRLGLACIDDQVEMPGATGYLLEEMVTDAVAELFVGFRRARPYGLTVTVGSGGTAAELLEDTVTLIAPVTATEVASALQALRLWPLLDGYRGRARADVNAAIDTVLRLQTLAMNEPEWVDIEVNPLILRTRGAIAVDAVIRRRI